MRPDVNLIDAFSLAVALIGAGCLLMYGVGTLARILEKLVEGARPRPMARKVRR